MIIVHIVHIFPYFTFNFSKYIESLSHKQNRIVSLDLFILFINLKLSFIYIFKFLQYISEVEHVPHFIFLKRFIIYVYYFIPPTILTC